MTIAVAVHEAIEARSSQLGFGPAPSPPMAVGMSVMTASPWEPVTAHRSPFCHVALAGGFDFLAAAGRSRNTRCNLSNDSRTRASDIIRSSQNEHRTVGGSLRSRNDHEFSRYRVVVCDQIGREGLEILLAGL